MYFVIIILLVDEHADHGHVVVTSRQWMHNRLLLERATRLFDANFIYRNLYCDIY